MKENFYKSLVFCVSIVAAVGMLASCNLAPESNYSLDGTWKSRWGEIYKFDEAKGTLDVEGGFALSNVVISFDFDSTTSGQVYGIYTRAYEEVYEDPKDSSWNHFEKWSKQGEDGTWSSEFSDPKDSSYVHYEYWWRYGSTASDYGKWYALRFWDYTGDSAKIIGAWKEDGVSSTATLEEAQSVFTKNAGYFEGYSEFTRVTE